MPCLLFNRVTTRQCLTSYQIRVLNCVVNLTSRLNGTENIIHSGLFQGISLLGERALELKNK